MITANEDEFIRRLRIAERVLLRLGSVIDELGDESTLGARLNRVYDRLSDYHEYLGDLTTGALVRGSTARGAGIEAGEELLDQMGIRGSLLKDG